MSTIIEYAIIQDGAVSDRFATEAEALAVIDQYPGAHIEDVLIFDTDNA